MKLTCFVHFWRVCKGFSLVNDHVRRDKFQCKSIQIFIEDDHGYSTSIRDEWHPILGLLIHSVNSLRTFEAFYPSPRWPVQLKAEPSSWP